MWTTFFNDALNGGMPAMEVRGTEICLENCSAVELLCPLVVSVEHVVQGAFLGLEPELVMHLDIAGNVVDGRFASAVDEGFIFCEIDRVTATFEYSGEEFILGFVTAIFGFGVKSYSKSGQTSHR